MVLITDNREAGGSSPVKLRQIYKSRSRSEVQVHPTAADGHEFLIKKDEYSELCGEGDYNESDFEDYDEFSELTDTRSIASDDSFYLPDQCFAEIDRTPSPEDPEGLQLSFFHACCSNNAAIVKMMIRQGVTEDEVREIDKNSRTGLIVACYQGYVDVVIALAECPYIDVNWQDNEGNTALITAAQAGHITTCNYLLNYYSGLDIERRNCHGFTALMKAAMQGKTDCVRTLMLAGADLAAQDDGRKLTPRQWALFTARYETAHLMLRLMTQPCPEQFSDCYQPEWSKLPELVVKAREPKGCLRRLSEMVSGVFSSGGLEPEEGGVMDHMVRATTGLPSPFVTLACRTVCPGSPPCVGKRRYAVQEILLKQQQKEQLKSLRPEHRGGLRKLFPHCHITLGPRKSRRRSSADNSVNGVPATQRRSSQLHSRPVKRSIVQPVISVPKIRVTKASPSTYKPEKMRKKSSCKDGNFLQIPQWRYKELKEERKRAEEAERRRNEEVERERKEEASRKRAKAGMWRSLSPGMKK